MSFFKTTSVDIGTGNAAVGKTLRLMREMIHAGARNWEVRWTAVQLVKHLPARDAFHEIEAIYKWLQTNLRFTRDPFRIELLHQPDVLLRLIRQEGVAAADCDDYVIVGAALLKSLGYRTRMKVIAVNRAGDFQHVYLEVLLGNDWLAFDPIRRDQPLGWEVTRTTRVLHVPIESGE